MFRSGRFISQTDGHGDFEPSTGRSDLCACHVLSDAYSHVADGADAVRRAVREELKDGAHQVKVMASGGVSSPTDPVDMVQYTSEELRAAVLAGVRSIEHATFSTPRRRA